MSFNSVIQFGGDYNRYGTDWIAMY